MPASSTIISMKVDVISLDNALLNVEQLANPGSGAYVCVSNVHMCMEVFDSSDFQQVVNNADFGTSRRSAFVMGSEASRP